MAEITLGRESTLHSLSLSQPWQYVLAAIAGTGFIALCAHLTIPLFFTPVPLTLQPFAVLLLGLLYGPRLGFATLALYLMEGASGLPVFQPHGAGGLAQLLGATGGYLMSYPVVAPLTGWLYRRWTGSFTAAALAAGIGSLVTLACGATWLGIYLHHNALLTLKLAVWPFLPGDALKVVAAAGIATAFRSWRLHNHRVS